jgi:6-phosphogluconolactonase (cycloisomerase 2 family)
MYESGRFKKPEDIFASPTENGFLFVTDSGTDSIYVFSNIGFEGVNPPANSSFKKQVIVSFGGSGVDGKASGPYNFVDPTGICFFNRTIFVCDKGNNRVCRYRLNSDLQ